MAAAALYLEHYLDSIENLPCELQRNFQLMRELDQRTEDKKAEIDSLATQYISTVRNLTSEQRVEILQKIQNAYTKCKEYSDDKVQLAMQTYEMVDKHIRRLDADLARFEADLKDKLEGSDFEIPGMQNLKKGRTQKDKKSSRGRGRRTSEEDAPVKKKPKRRSELAETILTVHPSDVLDMPVDPNEPTYCLCHQVSYGEMIGCDNPDVSLEIAGVYLGLGLLPLSILIQIPFQNTSLRKKKSPVLLKNQILDGAVNHTESYGEKGVPNILVLLHLVWLAVGKKGPFCAAVSVHALQMPPMEAASGIFHSVPCKTFLFHNRVSCHNPGAGEASRPQGNLLRSYWEKSTSPRIPSVPLFWRETGPERDGTWKENI
ncbi:inhibitor of growth protein 5 isoform X1 [Heteronotia binoei]|uniref:inhibitor of growth protein 5 isoform X1 n=1 Tax=Heteronotia binoei TaxID=13085 RepID=UPI00292FFB00|nr:inhibitor of growth protein 5 isoform X1 [Heteronotia binoei]